MMLKVLKKGEVQMQQRNDSPPQQYQQPRLSHRAAAVAQEMESLEASLASAEIHAQDAENRAKVAQDQLHLVTQELAHVRDVCDVYQRLYTDMTARLRAAGAIIHDVLRETERGKEAPKQQPDLEKLAQEIGEPENKEPAEPPA